MQPDPQPSNIQPSLALSIQQAQAITQFMGLRGAVQVTEVTRHNHIWRLQVEGESFYLKCYTKDWYGDDVPRTEYCVRHERDAYALLARHGVPVVEVALARPDCDNPLERPFLVTRALAGHSLNELLVKAEKREFQTLLDRAGEYMRRMHALTFAYPGYITGDGPTAAPAPGDWQHPAWSVQVCRQSALAALERERPCLSPVVASQLQATYASLDEWLAPAYQPLRFTQANMHSHQFFLERAGEQWWVTGVVDMEVASAGSAYYDLVAFALEMAAYHPVSTHWWEPFFHGYGGEPEFELFRLQMLTFGEASFKCFGPLYWPGTREEILARLLAADRWEALFVT